MFFCAIFQGGEGQLFLPLAAAEEVPAGWLSHSVFLAFWPWPWRESHNFLGPGLSLLNISGGGFGLLGGGETHRETATTAKAPPLC